MPPDSTHPTACSPWTDRRLCLPAIGFALLLAGQSEAATLPTCSVTDGMVASYDIVRGGNTIGRHTLRYTRRGADLIVDVTVEVSLSALGVRVYRYEHSGREVWRDGRMVSIETQTKDDGEKKQVNARFDPARNIWAGIAGSTPVTGPLMASSFWNSDTVRQTRFLDDETGQVNPVRVMPAGQEQLTLGGRVVAASKFDLAGTMSGTVWYDAGGCWIRALFHSPVDGSLIDVRARS